MLDKGKGIETSVLRERILVVVFSLESQRVNLVLLFIYDVYMLII